MAADLEVAVATEVDLAAVAVDLAADITIITDHTITDLVITVVFGVQDDTTDTAEADALADFSACFFSPLF